MVTGAGLGRDWTKKMEGVDFMILLALDACFGYDGLVMVARHSITTTLLRYLHGRRFGFLGEKMDGKTCRKADRRRYWTSACVL